MMPEPNRNLRDEPLARVQLAIALLSSLPTNAPPSLRARVRWGLTILPPPLWGRVGVGGSRNLRYLVLAPSMVAIVLLSSLAVEGISGNALGLLALSGVILIGTAVLWTGREGLTSPVPIIALGLLVYFPFRGVVLLTSGLTNEQGINQRVLDALSANGALVASVDVLIVAVLFAATCEILWRWRRPLLASAPAGAQPENPALRTWAIVLLLAGLVGIILQLPSGLGWLQGDEASGGLDWYLIYLASFGFSLGIILSGRANGRLPAGVWILLALVGAVAFYMGSKDTLSQPLVALLFAGAGVARARRSKARAALVGLTVAALVFLVFPAVTTYRNEIFAGQSVGQALAGVPGELATKTVVGSVPRTGGVRGYVEDSLLYLTNRLSGFDSLVLATYVPRDAQMLTPQTILLSPLGLVMPSGYWSSSVPQPGHYFGQQYWGSVPTNNVSIAITIFGEVHLAFGILPVPIAAILLGLVTWLAARYFRATSRVARAFGFIFMVTALGFEHDVLYLIITTERRLVLLAVVVGLAGVGRRRETLAPWAVRA